ncbi:MULTISPECIES: hypothetical protein [Bacillus cereus group]|uniref:hypothetical protein n=1 Tax=Bacillus cereus group TaxID=86661 RepID=UPI00187989E1|nr:MULTISPECIES: hypothetical protein [Bacillus cereus group]MBE7144979.1 hypothetical protein [Bacillus paranthracis]MDA1791769.1 hypothetical protein [Bacillus cereus group sp. BY5-1LC]
MWFDKVAYLQTLPYELENLFAEKGWKRTLFFQIKSGISKFIDVRLFESLGSDGERRRFGIANAYDTADSDFTDSRFISADSPLGKLGMGDGVKKEFSIPVFPISGPSVTVYVNGITQDKSTYTVDANTGKFTFKTAIGKGDKVTCEYRLAMNTYEPNNDMLLFTFSRYFIEKEIRSGDKLGELGTGDGTKKNFTLPFPNFDESRTIVYKNDTMVDPSEYSFTEKEVVFKTAPAATEKIKIAGIYFLLPKEDGTLDILTAKTNFDVQKMESIMGEVYSTINFVNPSPYTSISFTPEQRFSKELNRDSVVYLYGNANKDRMVMFMRVDPTPNPVRALFVPLYIGKLYTFDVAPRKNMVILSGCRPGDQFSYAPNKKIGNAPLDYGSDTSNGNETVQLSQSSTGAMYQHHYLAFITHDMLVDSGQGRFNPSVYSGKYHLSQIYIVHPNDGYVGKLDDVYAVHPKNIQQADELEIEKTVVDEVLGKGDGHRKVFHLEHKPKGDTLRLFASCREVEKAEYVYNADDKTVTFIEPPVNGSEITGAYEMAQLYRYTLPTTPISPMTQAKATPFNPIGLAIYKEDI